MHAEEQDLVALLEIQQLDLEAMQAKKKRVELPQRIEVMRLLKKRGEIQEKLDQVVDIQRKADAEMTIVEDEDRTLAEKQERAQELIDAAGSDYRAVESHSKEMAGAQKRRQTLSEKMEDIRSQQAKIAGIRAQLEGAISASEAEEKRLRASFQAEDQQLVDRIRELGDRRQELSSDLPPELLDLYARTADKVGGVAIGRMSGDTCGVCRTVIDGGRLIELKASAPLGICPSCKRLVVID